MAAGTVTHAKAIRRSSVSCEGGPTTLSLTPATLSVSCGWQATRRPELLPWVQPRRGTVRSPASSVGLEIGAGIDQFRWGTVFAKLSHIRAHQTCVHIQWIGHMKRMAP